VDPETEELETDEDGLIELDAEALLREEVTMLVGQMVFPGLLTTNVLHVIGRVTVTVKVCGIHFCSLVGSIDGVGVGVGVGV